MHIPFDVSGTIVLRMSNSAMSAIVHVGVLKNLLTVEIIHKTLIGQST